MDRIASAAKANKQAIYAYFGSKEALFGAAFEDRIRDFHASVDFDEYDLAEYAGGMFDKFEDPRNAAADPLVPARAGRWAAARSHPRLERGQAPANRSRPAGGKGDLVGTHPVALLGLARSTAMVWHTQIPELAALFPPDRRDRRDLVVRVIRQILDQ